MNMLLSFILEFMSMWSRTTHQRKCMWKAYWRSSIPRRWFAPATTRTRETTALLCPSTGVESDGIQDQAYRSRSEVRAQGVVTVPLPPWELLSLMAGKVITPLAESYHGRTWTYHLWARTTFLEALVIRRETLLGLHIQEESQCGQQISKTICFWQCALLHRWTVTFCSIWNIFSMHDFLS